MESGMIFCNLTIFCQFCLDKMGSFLYDDVKVLLNGKKIKQHGFVPCFHFYTLVNRVTFDGDKISTLDLNDAQNSKDEARQKHISELYYYWYYFYQLRSLTLWDFERNMELEADFEDIIKG